MFTVKLTMSNASKYEVLTDATKVASAKTSKASGATASPWQSNTRFKLHPATAEDADANIAYVAYNGERGTNYHLIIAVDILDKDNNVVATEGLWATMLLKRPIDVASGAPVAIDDKSLQKVARDNQWNLATLGEMSTKIRTEMGTNVYIVNRVSYHNKNRYNADIISEFCTFVKE